MVPNYSIEGLRSRLCFKSLSSSPGIPCYAWSKETSPKLVGTFGILWHSSEDRDVGKHLSAYDMVAFIERVEDTLTSAFHSLGSCTRSPFRSRASLFNNKGSEEVLVLDSELSNCYNEQETKAGAALGSGGEAQ